MPIKDKRRKTGFYWIQYKNGVKAVAKWWQSYNWFTQMGTVLEGDNLRNPIVHVYEKMLIPPEDPKKEKPKKIKRVRNQTTIKPKRKRIRTKPVVKRVRIKRTRDNVKKSNKN